MEVGGSREAKAPGRGRAQDLEQPCRLNQTLTQSRLGDGQPEDRALGAERSTPDSEKGEDKIRGEKGQQKSPAQPLHLSRLPDPFSSGSSGP